MAAQGGEDVGDHGAWRDRPELAPEMPGQHAISEIDHAVGGEQPHRGEVPLQCPAQPAAERDVARNLEGKERRGVVDAPAAHHHDHDGDDVDPMGHADHDGMDQQSLFLLCVFHLLLRCRCRIELQFLMAIRHLLIPNVHIIVNPRRVAWRGAHPQTSWAMAWITSPLCRSWTKAATPRFSGRAAGGSANCAVAASRPFSAGLPGVSHWRTTKSWRKVRPRFSPAVTWVVSPFS